MLRILAFAVVAVGLWPTSTAHAFTPEILVDHLERSGQAIILATDREQSGRHLMRQRLQDAKQARERALRNQKQFQRQQSEKAAAAKRQQKEAMRRAREKKDTKSALSEPRTSSAYTKSAIGQRAARAGVDQKYKPRGVSPASSSAVRRFLDKSRKTSAADRLKRRHLGKSQPHTFNQPSYSKIYREKKGLDHIKRMHLNRKLSSDKSQFNNQSTVSAVLTAAQRKPYIISKKNGNHVRIFQMPHHIGKVRDGSPTKTVTVITTPQGKLVTAFPGKPEIY